MNEYGKTDKKNKTNKKRYFLLQNMQVRVRIKIQVQYDSFDIISKLILSVW